MTRVIKSIKATAPSLLRVLGLFAAVVLAPTVVSSVLAALVLMGVAAMVYMASHPITKV